MAIEITLLWREARMNLSLLCTLVILLLIRDPSLAAEGLKVTPEHIIQQELLVNGMIVNT